MRILIETPDCSVDIEDETTRHTTLDYPKEKDLANILIRAMKGIGLNPYKVIKEMEQIE